jgi:L-aspartate oxidase
VLVITKGSIDDCNTKYAQGGIAAAVGKNDSFDLHYKDTVSVGCGLCDEEVVRMLVNEGADCISELVRFGVPFDTVDGEIALAMEAAHSVPRVLHAGGDATGEYIEMALSNRVSSSKIRVLENYLAIEILVEKGMARGLNAFNCNSGSIEQFHCRFLILATGGAGQLFKITTNSDVVTGDGIALAFNAGAEIADMEFFQFHPTALRLPGVVPFLISEAIRGEGGILLNVNGYRFMPDYTSKAELAPRDIVAQSIISEMIKTNSDRVFIDVTHLPDHTITARFPHIYHFCLQHSLDITKSPIPVAPAAHYMIGGIKTNSWGESNIAGLFACGESACTGVHGANRLASNSLLEAAVFSKRIIEKTSAHIEIQAQSTKRGTGVSHSLNKRRGDQTMPEPSLSDVQQLNWDKVGIMRNKKGLTEAANVLAAWQKCLPTPTDRYSYDLNHLILTSRLVTEAALIREESRGVHFRTDFPRSSSSWKYHITFTNTSKSAGS